MMHRSMSSPPTSKRAAIASAARISVSSAIAIITWLGVSTPARAQERGDTEAKECRHAATLLRAYDETEVRSGGQAAEGSGKAEQRQLAAARLLRCGALGGTTAARTIRTSRVLTNPVTLEALVGPFVNFRDTAVVNAVTSVADDASASTTARVYALRAVWVLRTGRYWTFYKWMLPKEASTPAKPLARCGAGVTVSDAKPYWRVGVEPAPGFEATLRALAVRLAYDRSQPVEVRAAAACALQD